MEDGRARWEEKKKSGGILASSLCFKIRERKTETPISKKKKKKKEEHELYVEIDISSYHRDVS